MVGKSRKSGNTFQISKQDCQIFSRQEKKGDQESRCPEHDHVQVQDRPPDQHHGLPQ